MSNYGWRPHIESALTLDVRRLARMGILREGARGSLTWSRDGTEHASLGYAVTLHEQAGTLTLSYTALDRDTGERKIITCTIALSSIPLHYGGRRWYLHSRVRQFALEFRSFRLWNHGGMRVFGPDFINAL